MPGLTLGRYFCWSNDSRLRNLNWIDHAQNFLVEAQQRFKIDIVLDEFDKRDALMVAACSEIGIPLILHFHGVDTYKYAVIAKYIKGYRNLFNHSSGTYALSKRLVEQFVQLGAPDEKIFLEHYGVDLLIF